MFHTFLLCICMCHLIEMKSVSVMEGDSVTLHIHLTDIQRDDQILWMFGPQETLIARIDKVFNKVRIYDDVHDGMFRGRLQVDDTGSLTITNITTQHSGLYHMTISSMTETSYTFSVTACAHLPVPVITRDSSSSSSSSSCVLLCSVMNVSHASLSWYKGKSLLSRINVSDLNIRLSLNLECLDDSYTCVLNNSITNQTQHLTTEDCHRCSDYINCCDTTEAVIRLVVSALVGVAAVAFLIYDIRSRRDEPRSSPNTLHLEIISAPDG